MRTRMVRRSGLERSDQTLQAVNSVLEGILLVVATLMWVGLLMTVTVDVTMRSIFNRPVLVGQELALFCFTWSVFLAGAVAFRRNMHFAIDVLPESMPRFMARTVELLTLLALAVFAYTLIVDGYDFARLGLKRYSQPSGYQEVWAYAAVPIAGVGIAAFTLERFVGWLLGRDAPLGGFAVE